MPVLEHDQLEKTISELKQQQQELLAELRKKKGRDFWEKVQLLSPLLSAILISSTGLICTYNYNQQQIKLQTIQTIEKFIPHLLGNEVSKKAAILALSSMGHTDLATKFAKLFASEGTVSALQTMAKDGDPGQKDQVNKALASALDTMADKYRADKQDAQAEEAYRRALFVRQSADGTNDADSSYTLEKLADLYMTHGDYNRAEPLLTRSLAIRQKLYGDNNPLVAETLKSLAEVYRLSGKTQEADAFTKRAENIDRAMATAPTSKPDGSAAKADTPPIADPVIDSSQTKGSSPATVDGEQVHVVAPNAAPQGQSKE